MPNRPLLFLLGGAALCAASTAPRAQDPAPPPPPLPEAARPAPAQAPVLDARNQPVEPGVLPSATTAAARELFERLCAASLGPGSERRPIDSFDLELDVRQRSSGQSNDLRARYRYRAPGFVRTTLLESGREHLRGPRGDFLLDPKTKSVTDLATGRENAEDRREIEDTLRTARNFLALTDPRSLRLVSLEAIPAPAIALPNHVRGPELAWLELRTPDFQAGGPAPERETVPPPPPIGEAAKETAAPAAAASTSPAAATPPAVARVRLGIDPKTGLVATALVDQNEKLAGLRDSTLLLALEAFKPIDGFQVPTRILLFQVEEGSRPPAFGAHPNSDITVIAIRSKMRANLKPEDFLP